MEPPVTPDGRYFVVRGRLWRCTDPQLDAAECERLTKELMSARRAKRTDDPEARERARQRVDAGKRALGERGPVWWNDGAPDYGGRMARNTPYAEWHAALPHNEPSDSRPGLPDTRLGRRLQLRRDAVLELAEAAGAHNVRVFGSVARAEDSADSDIDLLVDLDDGVSLVTLNRLTGQLTNLLGVTVDVIPAETLKAGVRERVLAEAIQL